MPFSIFELYCHFNAVVFLYLLMKKRGTFCIFSIYIHSFWILRSFIFVFCVACILTFKTSDSCCHNSYFQITLDCQSLSNIVSSSCDCFGLNYL